ncbi:hypothetical protein, partial [Martelella sp. UBA3392]|uniref:hypothetical protein n=2 Tax=Hyphomicrobiales TaxID=356 RepID=UPI0031F569E8
PRSTFHAFAAEFGFRSKRLSPKKPRSAPSFPHEQEEVLMPMTREEVEAVLGPVDDVLVADLISTGASAEELREAWAWFNSDEALIGAGRPLPGSRIGELIDMLDEREDDGA